MTTRSATPAEAFTAPWLVLHFQSRLIERKEFQLHQCCAWKVQRGTGTYYSNPSGQEVIGTCIKKVKLGVSGRKISSLHCSSA